VRCSGINIESAVAPLLQYESLRSQVLKSGKNVIGSRHGLALFIHQGMLTWIEVCHKCMPAASTSGKQAEATVRPPHETASEMIKVLANMTVFCLNEHGACG
jgi:hypothetical protein